MSKEDKDVFWLVMLMLVLNGIAMSIIWVVS